MKPLTERALDTLLTLAEYLIESHQSEFETCHEGDSEHSGEAPEVCSYCLAIDEARQLLIEAGRDVEALEPC